MRSIQLILDGLIGSSFENFLITHVRNDIILKSSLPLELFQNQVWIAVSEVDIYMLYFLVLFLSYPTWKLWNVVCSVIAMLFQIL